MRTLWEKLFHKTHIWQYFDNPKRRMCVICKRKDWYFDYESHWVTDSDHGFHGNEKTRIRDRLLEEI
jgi:hypothetical protein